MKNEQRNKSPPNRNTEKSTYRRKLTSKCVHISKSAFVHAIHSAYTLFIRFVVVFVNVSFFVFEFELSIVAGMNNQISISLDSKIGNGVLRVSIAYTVSRIYLHGKNVPASSIITICGTEDIFSRFFFFHQ